LRALTSSAPRVTPLAAAISAAYPRVTVGPATALVRESFDLTGGRTWQLNFTLARPTSSVSADATKYALSPAQCDGVIAAVRGAAAAFPWVKTNLVHNEADRPGLFRETFADEVYQFTIDAPWDAQKEKGALIAEIQRQFDTAGLGLRVSDAGDAVLFGNASVDKSLALADYARQLGTHADRIAKFGDKAGASGNDKHLRGAHAYNVGKDAAHFPEVSDAARGQHALGTVATVEKLLAANAAAKTEGREPPVRAFMFDFDGTLTMPGTHGINPTALDMLVSLLDRGQDFAICTGRGPALFPLVLDQLVARGVKPAVIAAHMSVFMFNGARPLQRSEAFHAVHSIAARSYITIQLRDRSSQKPG
jgi:hydroxymethylpyrimidine pyrophosphatase-like HAD family hydrolase